MRVPTMPRTQKEHPLTARGVAKRLNTAALRRVAAWEAWSEGHPARRTALIVSAFSLLLGVLAVHALLRPAYNWDMLGYIGVAEAVETRDPAEVQRRTYAAAKAAVPPAAYRDLVGAAGDGSPDVGGRNRYRQVVAADPEAFRQQLPFYAVKPLYPALIYGLTKAGLNPVDASVLLAVLGFLGAMIVILWWFARHHGPLWALLFASLVALSIPLSELAKLSTPDSLSILLVVLGAMALIELRRTPLSLILFGLAIVDRPNTVALTVLLVVYLALWAPPDIALSGRAAVIAGALTIGLYAGLSTWSGMYSIPTFLYHSTTEYLPYPASFVSPFGLFEYAKLYAFEFFELKRVPFFLFVLIGVIVVRLRLDRTDARHDILAHVTPLVLLSLPVQWLVHPTEMERLMAPLLVLLIVFLVISVGRSRPTGAEPARGQRPITAS